MPKRDYKAGREAMKKAEAEGYPKRSKKIETTVMETYKKKPYKQSGELVVKKGEHQAKRKTVSQKTFKKAAKRGIENL